MPSLVSWIANLATPWHDLYSDSEWLPVAVVFMHLVALLIGGGLALSADLATMRVVRTDAGDRDRQLRALKSTHPLVLAALSLSAATGVLLFLADVEELAQSRIFWTKLLLLGLLAANGFWMMRMERALRLLPATDADVSTRWRSLHARAVSSGLLWFALLLCGTILGNS